MDSPDESKNFGAAKWLPLGILIAGLIIAADQITKSIAINNVIGDTHVVGPLHWKLVANNGTAFGLADSIAPVLVVVALVGIAWFASKTAKTRLDVFLWAVIFGGALSNVVDRVFREGHSVVDFISVGWWPTFNLADAAVTCGIVVLIWTQRKTLFKR